MPRVTERITSKQAYLHILAGAYKVRHNQTLTQLAHMGKEFR